MDKVAEMTRMAEVRGCMAAFVDAGLVKVANDASFDNLCETVASNIGYDYNLEKIAQATENALTGGANRNETARNAALGELLMMKTAGQIDSATFKREAAALMKTAAGEGAIKGLLGKARGAAGSFMDALKGKGIGGALDEHRIAKHYQSLAKNPLDEYGQMASGMLGEARKNLAKKVGRTALAYGTLGAGTLGTGTLGKSLYDKYSA